VRDEFGAAAGPERRPPGLFPLSLTRSGWHNSLELPRSDLQRVHYYLEDEAPVARLHHSPRPRAVDTQLQRVRLLDGVENLELRFLAAIDDLLQVIAIWWSIRALGAQLGGGSRHRRAATAARGARAAPGTRRTSANCGGSMSCRR
jgi:hypothetical protein